MSDASGRTSHAAPNTTNTIRPGVLNVEFVLWNYVAPTDLNALVDSDFWDWSISRNEPGFLEKVLPELRQVAEFLGFASKITGHDSSQLESVRDQEQFDRLLGARLWEASTDHFEPAVLVPEEMRALTSECANDFATQQYLHLFEKVGQDVSPGTVVEYLDGKTWVACLADGSEAQSKNQRYRVDAARSFYVIALPYKLTQDGLDSLHTLLQNPNWQAQMEPFLVDFDETALAEAGAERDEGFWRVPIFAPMHVALATARLLGDRLTLASLVDPASDASSLDDVQKEIRYRGLLSGMVKSLIAADSSLAGHVNSDLLELDYLRFNESFRSSVARLMASLEFMLNSWAVLHIEDICKSPQEMSENGPAWSSFFRILSQTLSAHPRGSSVVAHRQTLHGEGKMVSPIVLWLQHMVDESIVGNKVMEAEAAELTSNEAAELEKSFWNASGTIGKALGFYDSLFTLYVTLRISDIPTRGNKSLLDWNKTLEEAGATFKQKLGKLSTAQSVKTSVMGAISNTIKYSTAIKNVVDGKAGRTEITLLSGQAKSLLEQYGTSELDNVAAYRMAQIGLVLGVVGQLAGIKDYSTKSWDTISRGDYDAAVGAGIALAASAIGLGITAATGAAPSGPVAILIGLAVTGGALIYAAAIDSDVEVFLQNSIYRKAAAGVEVKEHFGFLAEYWDAPLEGLERSGDGVVQIGDRDFRTSKDLPAFVSEPSGRSVSAIDQDPESILENLLPDFLRGKKSFPMWTLYRIQYEALLAAIYKLEEGSLEISNLSPSDFRSLPSPEGKGIDFEVAVNPESFGAQLLVEFEKDGKAQYAQIEVERFGSLLKAHDFHYGAGRRSLDVKTIRSDGPVFHTCAYHASKVGDKWRCTISFTVSDLVGATWEKVYLRLVSGTDRITAPAGNIVIAGSEIKTFDITGYEAFDLDRHFGGAK